jgi:hypothetical protein
MSIAHHFAQAPDARFIRSYDFRTARRQFQVSVALILILTFVAFSLAPFGIFEAPRVVDSNSPTSAYEIRFADGGGSVIHEQQIRGTK